MLRYEQAEVVEHELQHMTEQVKSIIQTMNATQVLIDFLFS
jgi:nuclear pore complex protein Nup62